MKYHPDRIHSTITNIFYLFAGIFAYLNSSYHAWYFLVTCIALTISSGMFHWTKNYFWQKADEISMYAVLLAILFRHFYEFSYNNPETYQLYWIAPLVISIAAGILHKRSDSTFTVGLIFWIDIGCLAMYLPISYYLSPIIIASLAYATRQIGEKYKNGKYEDLLHGYGWHLLTSIMLYLLYQA